MTVYKHNNILICNRYSVCGNRSEKKIYWLGVVVGLGLVLGGTVGRALVVVRVAIPSCQISPGLNGTLAGSINSVLPIQFWNPAWQCKSKHAKHSSLESSVKHFNQQ
jgi:hypothetical protein